jgi:hypothetical protein
VVWTGCYSWRSKQISAVIQGCHQCQRGRLLACFQAVCLSLMARSEYAAMEKQGQRKLRRISAEVHAECKSVLDHLMVYRQARKIRDKLIQLHFRVSDTRRWRCQGHSRQVPESRNAKRRNPRKQETVSDTRDFGYRELGMSITLTTGVLES